MAIALSLRDRAALILRGIAGTLPTDTASVGGRLLAGVIQAGGQPPVRGTKEVVAGYNTMPWLRAVVSRISYDVAATEWQCYVKRKVAGKWITRDHRAVRDAEVKWFQSLPYELKRAGKTVTRSELIKAAVDAGDLEPLDSHPFLDLLGNFNTFHTGLAGRRVTQQHLDLVGEAFWLVERDPRGMPVALWPIAPAWILGTPTVARPLFRVSFRAWQGTIPASEIVWFTEVDPANPYTRGTGTAMALGDELETDEYACHDDQTECLTERGWVRGLDLKSDDDVATWSESRGALEYERPSALHRYEYNGLMDHWSGRSIDAMVTPNHRLWIKSRVYRRPAHDGPFWHFETSAQASGKDVRPIQWRDAGSYRGTVSSVEIPGVARVTKRRPGSRGGGRPPRRGVADPLQFDAVEFGRFLGYYISEGHAAGASASVCQTEGRYVEDIRSALRVFPSDWVTERSSVLDGLRRYRWSVAHLGLAEWLRAQCGEGAYFKRIPDQVFEWEREAQAEFLRGLCNGDGSWHESSLGESCQYVTRSRQLADDLQRLCVLMGYSSVLSDGINNGVVGYSVTIRLHTGVRRFDPSASQVIRAAYSGEVWCATTANGTLVTRRNGRVLISGNSKHIKAFYFNRARPDLIVSPKSDDGMGPDEVSRLEEGWAQKSQGFWRSFKPFFLRRPVEIKELDQSMRAQQFVQIREFERNCYDDQTEALTRRGWVRGLDLHDDDEVAAWDPLWQQLKYRRPDSLVRQSYSGDMHLWKNERIDACVTPNHRMYVRGQDGEWGFVTSEQCRVGLRPLSAARRTKTRTVWRIAGAMVSSGGVATIQIPNVTYGVPRTVGRHGYEIDEAYYEFDTTVFGRWLGYWLAEGSLMNRPGASGEPTRFGLEYGQTSDVNEAEPVGVAAEMVSAATALDVGAVRVNRKTQPTRGGHAFYGISLSNRSLWYWVRDNCGVGSAQKRLPRCVFTWPAPAQRALLEAMIDGDGHRYDTGAWYATSSRQLADDVQELCVLLGLRASRSGPIKGGNYDGQPCADMFQVNISHRQVSWVKSDSCSVVPYTGEIWCVDLGGAAFVTRRNGRIAIHGNTVIQVYGVSPEMFGITEGSNRATVSVAEYIYGRRVLVPRLELQRATMQERLVPEFDERIILDYVSPVAKDTEAELKAAELAPYALSVDEWRSRMGESSLPDGLGTIHLVSPLLQPTRFDEPLAPEPVPPAPPPALPSPPPPAALEPPPGDATSARAWDRFTHV